MTEFPGSAPPAHNVAAGLTSHDQAAGGVLLRFAKRNHFGKFEEFLSQAYYTDGTAATTRETDLKSNHKTKFKEQDGRAEVRRENLEAAREVPKQVFCYPDDNVSFLSFGTSSIATHRNEETKSWTRERRRIIRETHEEEMIREDTNGTNDDIQKPSPKDQHHKVSKVASHEEPDIERMGRNYASPNETVDREKFFGEKEVNLTHNDRESLGAYERDELSSAASDVVSDVVSEVDSLSEYITKEHGMLSQQGTTSGKSVDDKRIEELEAELLDLAEKFSRSAVGSVPESNFGRSTTSAPLSDDIPREDAASFCEETRDTISSDLLVENEALKRKVKELTDELDSLAADQDARRQQKRKGYKFGDLTKKIVNRGKRLTGRDDKDKYKFGDFSRGLFGHQRVAEC